MEGIGWLGVIVAGILAGWIAEKVMKRNHGLLTNLIVGLIGAVIGKFVLMNVLGVAYAGFLPSVGAAVVGALILLFLLGLIRKR